MYAHFFKLARGGEVAISRTPALNVGHVDYVPVKDKREARRVADQFGAQAWNF